jgi:hypothetical protein
MQCDLGVKSMGEIALLSSVEDSERRGGTENQGSEGIAMRRLAFPGMKITPAILAFAANAKL